MNCIWVAFLPQFLRNRLEGRQNLQKILGNSGWLVFDKIFRMGLGLFIGAWTARYLGPEQYGKLGYAIAFATLFSAVATLGLDSMVVSRNIIREPEKTDLILGTAFALRIIGAIVTIFLTIFTIILVKSLDSSLWWLVAIISLGSLFQVADIIDYWFQSQVASKYVVFARSISFILLCLVRVVLIVNNASLVYFAWAITLETAVAAFALLGVYKASRAKISHWRFDAKLAMRMLHDCWPLILSGIVTMIYLRIDQVMLGQMAGNKELGYYSAAVRLAEVWYFLPMAVSSSVFPSIVDARSISEELFYERLQKLYNLLALLAYAIAIPTTLLAGWIVAVIYGSSYAPSGIMLAILIWAGLFVNLGVARSSFLITMNFTKLHFLTVLCGCILNVVLNFFLIPRFGGVGAATASCISYWFAAHGSCFLFKQLNSNGLMMTRSLIYPKIW